MKFLVFLFSILLSTTALSQKVDWYELVIIPDLQNVTFLVIEVDSINQKCSVREEPTYCTDAEHAHDYKVPSLRKKQEKAIKKSGLKCELVRREDLNKEKFAQLEKYPFVIEYDFDLIALETGFQEQFFLKLDFLLLDRSTGNIIGRSMQHNIEEPFEPMHELFDELRNFQELE